MSEKTSPAINLICDFKVGSSKGESYKILAQKRIKKM